MRRVTGALAYQHSAAHRGPRDQEADVFRRVNAGLRAAQAGDGANCARAVADNHRLWLMVADLMRDPANALPAPLRASVISVGLAVKRECQKAEPDLAFLIGVNENIAAGLSGV